MTDYYEVDYDLASVLGKKSGRPKGNPDGVVHPCYTYARKYVYQVRYLSVIWLLTREVR